MSMSMNMRLQHQFQNSKASRLTVHERVVVGVRTKPPVWTRPPACVCAARPDLEAAGPSDCPVVSDDAASTASSPAWTSLRATQLQELGSYTTIFYLAAALSASAAEEGGLTYSPEQGGEAVKSAAGVFYVGLVVYFLYRLLKRRAKRAKEQVTPLSGKALCSA